MDFILQSSYKPLIISISQIFNPSIFAITIFDLQRIFKVVIKIKIPRQLNMIVKYYFRNFLDSPSFQSLLTGLGNS